MTNRLRSPDLLSYLIQGLRSRAAQLLGRATSRCNPLTVARVCALTATAYRALARASQMRADLMQRLARVVPMCEACAQAETYAHLAGAYAHVADTRGA